VVTDPQTHPQTHAARPPQTGPITIHFAAKLSAQCNYLVLEEAAAERPDAGEDEVQLVPLLGTVWRRVFRREQTFQQVAQHLQVTVVADRRYLLELERQTRRNVFIEQNGQVGAFRLHLASVYPTTHVPADHSSKRLLAP